MKSGKKTVPSLASWHVRSDDLEMIELAHTYTPFQVLVPLRSLGADKDHFEDEVHDRLKQVAEYAVERGISLVAGLDVRLAIPSFAARYPDELQENMLLREIRRTGDEPMELRIKCRVMQDHYHRPYVTRSVVFVRAFAYSLTSEGLIDPLTLQDMTEECEGNAEANNIVRLNVKAGAGRGATHAMFMVSFTLGHPDVFAPSLPRFLKELVLKYADVPLAGANTDEWGFPFAYAEEPQWNEFWFSRHRAFAYAARTGGRELIGDLLLMYRGIQGRENERFMAINHFAEMCCQRNAELETCFYDAVKEAFGPEGIIGVHPTSFPYPQRREFKKNGLNWWAAKRDWAQVDEIVPFAIRTSLAKKWNSPVWYNMFYRLLLPQGAVNGEDFVRELWSSALAGGRVNNLAPSSLIKSELLSGDFIRAETRIRLLNYIDPSPLDCPVAVVFGHAAAMNWAGPSFEDVGLNLTDQLWQSGVPADLIPTSEIHNNSLTVDQEGFVRYGEQRYAAVVLVNPEFEKASTASFFQQAARGSSVLFRIGNWTMDFDGNDFAGNQALPESMRRASSIEAIADELLALMRSKGYLLQTPATRRLEGFGYVSYAPPTAGCCRLLDGTHIEVSGTVNGAGDNLKSSIKVGLFDVSYDAVGVAAVRLDSQGNLLALAAGGLKSLEAGGFLVQLEERIDLALWTRDDGTREGVLQGWQGDIPAALLSLTSLWTCIDLPAGYPTAHRASLFKVVVSEKNCTDACTHDESTSELRVEDIEGNVYQAVKIGEQIWMAENLRTSTYHDGEPIVMPGSDKMKWYGNHSGSCASYHNAPELYDSRYGKLYDWQALQTGRLCPVGWRIPTAEDWEQLLRALERDGSWFNPVAGGYRHPLGSDLGLDLYGIWWSSTGVGRRAVWERGTGSFYVTNEWGGGKSFSPSHALSVRCILKC